jgi:hypothetical protein
VRREYDPPLTQHRHRMPDGGVRHPVLVGKTPLAGKLRGDLALADPPLNIVRNLDIGVLSPKRINRPSRHMITIGCSLSCKDSS